jgi:hypothetical protein
MYLKRRALISRLIKVRFLSCKPQAAFDSDLEGKGVWQSESIGINKNKNGTTLTRDMVASGSLKNFFAK